ncbi:MAG: hypothetical protein AAFU34_15605 [Pseudomonadota bacterium]
MELYALLDEPSDEQFRQLQADAVPSMTFPGIAEAQEVPWNNVDWVSAGPVADAYMLSDADIIGLMGPVGSGKTTANLRHFFRRARFMPKSNIDGIRRYKVTMVRATYRQLWSTTIPSWLEVMPKSEGRWSGGRGDPVTHFIEYWDEFGKIEFTIEFQAFGTSVAEIEANIRGLQTTDLSLDEADTVHPTVLTKGLGRIDRYPSKRHYQATAEFEAVPRELQSQGQISCVFNAPDVGNYTVRVFKIDTTNAGLDTDEGARARRELEDKGVRIEFYRQPGYGEDGCENLHNLGDKYYERQIAGMRAEGRSNDIKRLIYNKMGFVRIGDPVFENQFDEQKHVARKVMDPDPRIPLMIGLDQGYFGAAVIGQFVAPFQWRIYAELYFANGSFAPQFGEALKRLLKTERFRKIPIGDVFCDLAGSQKESVEDQTWISEVSAASGLEIEPQQLGGNRVAPRLAVWAAAMDNDIMGRQGLLICPSCQLLIRGLANDYVWTQDTDAAENASRKPKKKGIRAADVIDAGGYMMMSKSEPDGTPGSVRIASDMLGHNGGPALDDDPMGQIDDTPRTQTYDFDPLEDW